MAKFVGGPWWLSWPLASPVALPTEFMLRADL